MSVSQPMLSAFSVHCGGQKHPMRKGGTLRTVTHGLRMGPFTEQHKAVCVAYSFVCPNRMDAAWGSLSGSCACHNPFILGCVMVVAGQVL